MQLGEVDGVTCNRLHCEKGIIQKSIKNQSELKNVAEKWAERPHDRRSRVKMKQCKVLAPYLARLQRRLLISHLVLLACGRFHPRC